MLRDERENRRKELRHKFVAKSASAMSLGELIDLVNYSTMEIDELRAEVERLTAVNDRYKAALDVAIDELAKKNRHTRQETCETASARALIEIDRILHGSGDTGGSYG